MSVTFTRSILRKPQRPSRPSRAVAALAAAPLLAVAFAGLESAIVLVAGQLIQTLGGVR